MSEQPKEQGPGEMPAVGVRVELDTTDNTITTDAARVWLVLHEDGREETLSVAVMVRSVSNKSPLQLGVHAMVVDAVKKAALAAFAGPTINVWTEAGKAAWAGDVEPKGG